MKILVFNCGSSSIKYRLFEMPEGRVIAKGIVERIGEDNSKAVQEAGKRIIEIKEKVVDHRQALTIIEKILTDSDKGPLKSMSEIGACGHRVVHGGKAFTGSVIVNEELEKVIEQYSELAPLHNPPNLTGIRAARVIMGSIPQVACFDTAFHQSIQKVAYLYALPRDMYEKYRVRRYGFHGTSHRYVARRAAEFLSKGKYDVNLITCHLGNGCSITAVKEGRSVDTSMGLTPLEGLIMGTRSGDVDPAVIFYLVRKGYKLEELDAIFNKKSGLLGISGVSNDVRDLEKRAAEGHKESRLALDMFAYRIRKYIGAYMAVLNGCDAIVFTGGIGENGSSMRRRILENIENIGIRLDNDKNRAVTGREGEIHSSESRVKLLVIPTDEEGAIARDTYEIAVEKNKNFKREIL